MSDQLLTMSPFEFLQELVKGWTPDGRRVVVQGDVDLCMHSLRKLITTIPEVTIEGDLRADGSSALITCKCNVTGDVNLDDSPIKEFSPTNRDKVAVRGNFSAKRCRQFKVLSGEFGQDVHLDQSSIEEIDNDFSCEMGDLSVEQCLDLKRLNCSARSILADGSSIEETGRLTKAENFSAGGCLRLKKATPILGLKWANYDGSGINEVDDGFNCLFRAEFRRCRALTRLGGSFERAEVSLAPLRTIDNLNVKEIVFSDCPSMPSNVSRSRVKKITFLRCEMESLPTGIPDGDLTIAKCRNFTRLPETWKGDLKLSELPRLEETSRDFRCEGNLEIVRCDGLRKIRGVVGGDLRLLKGSLQLKKLDNSLEVRGSLFIRPGSQVTSLDCRVTGGVHAQGGELIDTGLDFYAGGSANFQGSAELVTLRGMFERDVVLDESSVQALGADFECRGNVSLRKTSQLRALNCTVWGSVIVEDSTLNRTGPAFFCKKDFKIAKCPKRLALSGEVLGGFRVDGTWVGGGGKFADFPNSIGRNSRSEEPAPPSPDTPKSLGRGGSSRSPKIEAPLPRLALL